MGDALWSLPTVLALSRRHDCQVDFYTSEYCLPLKRLFEFQSYIAELIVPEGYRVRSMDCGCQPWQMPIEESRYEAVYQLGFRGIPGQFIANHIAHVAGVQIEPIRIECPTFEGPILGDRQYLVLAARGETSYRPLFQDIIRKSRLPIVQIGTAGDIIAGDTINRSEDLLETATIIAGSSGFIGLMSSQLVISGAFPIVKVAPHDGIHWDMSHVMRSTWHHYPVNPTAEQVLNYLP